MPVGSTSPSESKGARRRAPSRVIIEGVHPEIDGGRFPIKRVIGEDVVVSADAYGEGHDMLAVVLRHRRLGDEAWSEEPMTALGNDRWTARFVVTTLGRYEYTIQAWVDGFATWQRDLRKRVEVGQDLASELLEGAEFVRAAARRARRRHRLARPPRRRAHARRPGRAGACRARSRTHRQNESPRRP